VAFLLLPCIDSTGVTSVDSRKALDYLIYPPLDEQPFCPFIKDGPSGRQAVRLPMSSPTKLLIRKWWRING